MTDQPTDRATVTERHRQIARDYSYTIRREGDLAQEIADACAEAVREERERRVQADELADHYRRSTQARAEQNESLLRDLRRAEQRIKDLDEEIADLKRKLGLFHCEHDYRYLSVAKKEVCRNCGADRDGR